MRLNMEASLHGIAEKKPIKAKFMKVVIENQAMTTDCSFRYKFSHWQSKAKVRATKCFWRCGENFGTRAKRPLRRVIVIGRNSRQTSLSGFDLREPTIVIYLCLQNLMDGSIWAWWFLRTKRYLWHSYNRSLTQTIEMCCFKSLPPLLIFVVVMGGGGGAVKQHSLCLSRLLLILSWLETRKDIYESGLMCQDISNPKQQQWYTPPHPATNQPSSEV